MSVGLRGVLRDFGIAEVFQLIGQQRKTGGLEIERGKRRVELQFDEGSVVAAAPVGAHPDEALGDMLVRCGRLTGERLRELTRERERSLQTLPRLLVDGNILPAQQVQEIEELLTRETIFEVLRWTEGSFRFTSRSVSHDRDPTKLIPAEQILMDGLRMADEWRTFSGDVPSEDAVFQRVGRFETYREGAEGDARSALAEAQSLFRLIDGRLSVRRVIDLSRLGTFEGTRLLSVLRRASLIEPIDPRRLPPLERTSRARMFPLVRVRSWIAAALPLVLLAALATSVALGSPIRWTRGEPAGLPIERSPLIAGRVAFQTKRVRRALETYRFMTGEWPDRLSELAARGLIAGDALTPLNGHPYYYARRGEDALLLAPEH